MLNALLKRIFITFIWICHIILLNNRVISIYLLILYFMFNFIWNIYTSLTYEKDTCHTYQYLLNHEIRYGFRYTNNVETVLIWCMWFGAKAYKSDFKYNHTCGPITSWRKYIYFLSKGIDSRRYLSQRKHKFKQQRIILKIKNMFFQKSDFVAKAVNLKPSYQDIIILVKRDALSFMFKLRRRLNHG